MAVSWSRANISVSGTYRPPYGPNRPRAFGTAAEVDLIGVGGVRFGSGEARGRSVGRTVVLPILADGFKRRGFGTFACHSSSEEFAI